MKRNNLIIIALIAVFTVMNSCSDEFLEQAPKGSLDESTLASADGVDALLIGAYALLDGTASGLAGWQGASSNWVYGSIRGMTANKGTDSGDQPDINPLQTFSETATNPYLNDRWRVIYDGVARCNTAILVAANALADGAIDQAQHDNFVNQARGMRGWFHFEAWRMWDGKVPWVDETTDQQTLDNLADIRGNIIADMEAAEAGLPTNMGQIGRFNKTVMQVLLARAEMQMNGNYSKALGHINDAMGGTKPDGSAIGLAPTFGEIFTIANRNEIESIYTIQYSVNDGSGGWNGGWGEVLNFPYKSGASPGGCCGFFQPTQEFVNSFRTSGGLPLLDNSYNNDPVLNDQGLDIDDASYVEDPGELDPRLDWTVGRRGIPYWDWGDHTGQDWIRDQSYAGPFSPKKQVYQQSDEGSTTEVGGWTSGWTANGYRMIRYAELLLIKAECEIQLGQDDLGLGEINQLRARAANTAGFVTEADGTTPAADYVINEYPANYGGEDPMEALMMERKLELGMEGHRWFDLNRWGITQSELTRVMDYEITQAWGPAAYGEGSANIGPEDASFPIPQRQIEVSNNKLEQIAGH